MTKNPYKVEENILASEVLLLMNKKKITSVCVYRKNNKKNCRCYSYSLLNKYFKIKKYR